MYKISAERGGAGERGAFLSINVSKVEWVEDLRIVFIEALFLLAHPKKRMFYCRMPHKCHGNAKNCPSRSHEIWEMPINELDRRDDPDFDEALTGCHLVSSCSNIYYREQFR